MAQETPRAVSNSISNWWLYLLTGILLIVVGIWVFRSPAESYVSLSILFAVGILVTGIFEIAFALSATKSLEGWGWTLAGGILDLVIGIYLFMYPAVSLAVLPFVVGFWLLFRGFSAIGFSFDLKSYKSSGWGLLLLLGILISFFGIMVLSVPAFGVLNIIIWTALSFISAGVFRVVLAFRLRKLLPK